MIDTRQKRMSLIGLSLPVPSLLPPGDGTFSTQDKLQFLWLYAGLMVVAPRPPVRISAPWIPWYPVRFLIEGEAHFQGRGGMVAVATVLVPLMAEFVLAAGMKAVSFVGPSVQGFALARLIGSMEAKGLIRISDTQEVEELSLVGLPPWA